MATGTGKKGETPVGGGRQRVREGEDHSIKMFEPLTEPMLPMLTPSPFPNNLSVVYIENSNMIHSCISHMNEVALVSWDPRMEKQKSDSFTIKDPVKSRNLTVIQCKLVIPANRNGPLLVVASTIGAMVFDTAGTRPLLSFNPLEVEMLGADANKFCRGITCVDNNIFVGTCTGEIMHFSCGSATSVTVKKAISEHTSAIVDLATCKFDELTCSADSVGDIIVWSKNCKSAQKKIHSNQQLTVINVLRKQVLCGGVFGKVFIYATQTGALMCEVAAHGRPVTAIAVAPESAYVLTASEDSCVRVFKLHTRKPEAYQMEFRYGDEVDNRMLVGAQFANDRGSSMIFSAFDYPQLIQYKIFKKSVAPAVS